MNLAFVIYMIDRLDAIVYGPLTVFSCLALIVLLFMGLFYYVAGGDSAVESYKLKESKNSRASESEHYAHLYYNLPTKAIMWCCIPLVVASLLVPDKDTMYTILAAYGVQEVAENEDVQEFAGKSLDVLEKAMDEYLAEND